MCAILETECQSQDFVFCTGRQWPKSAGSPLGYGNVDREFTVLLRRARPSPDQLPRSPKYTPDVESFIQHVPVAKISGRLGYYSTRLTLYTYS
ncbi:MAG: hypothetical protein WKH64_17625 [Chloroflexia bacterium]